MKVISVFTLLFIFSFTAFAQISITNTNMPQAGDTLRFSVAPLDTAVLFGYQNNGPNQTWNFDSLTAIRQGLDEYFASSSTPYAAQVSGRIGFKVTDTLSLGGISLYDVYDFFQNTSTEYAQDYRAASVPTGLGWPFPAVLALAPAFTDRDEVYQFPLNYLDRDSSTFDFAYTNALIGAYYGSNGYRINEVDAWGTIVTPYDTFNTIRVITDVVAYDSVSFGGNSFGINSHSREYKWLSTQERIPVFSLSGNVVLNQFIPTNVQFRDTAKGLPPIFAPIALFNADTTVVSLGDTLSFNNLSLSLTPTNSTWSVSPATHAFTNGTNSSSREPIVQFNDTGAYNIQLIISNNQGSDTLLRPNYIQVVTPVGLAEKAKKKMAFSLFPNPAKKGSPLWLRINEGASINELLITNIKGQQIHRIRLNAPEQHAILLPTQHLPKGQYFIIGRNGIAVVGQAPLIVH
jgi:PKD repeat protein